MRLETDTHTIAVYTTRGPILRTTVTTMLVHDNGNRTELKCRTFDTGPVDPFHHVPTCTAALCGGQCTI